jgi:hypothetical protein
MKGLWQTKELLSSLQVECGHAVSLIFPFFERRQAKCRWLMPVILATQEAEIRRITV